MRMTRRLLQSLPISLLFMLSQGCADGFFGHACTLIGCATDGVIIDLGRTDAMLPGTYAITANDGIVDRICTVTMPGANLSGCNRAFPDDGKLRVFYLDFAPALLNVTVTREDEPWASVSGARPIYTETRPNGPECPPVCRHAEVVVSPAL